MTDSKNPESFYHRVARSLARKSFLMMFVNGVSAILTIGLHISFARILGHKNYSDYAYALTLLTILAVPGVLGMDTAAQRFVSTYQALADWSALRGFLRQSLRLVLLSSILLAVLSAVLMSFLGELMRPELAQTCWTAIWVLPSASLLLLNGAVLRALHSPLLAAVPRLIVRPILLVVAVVLVGFLVGRNLSGQVGMLLELGATIAALVLIIVFVRRECPAEVYCSGVSLRSKQWVSAAFPMLGIALMQLMLRSTDVLLLGYFHGTATSGPYSAASRISLLSAFGLLAVNAVLPPLIARYHAREELHDLQGLLTLAARGTFAFSALGAGAIILFRAQALAAFGAEFGRASTALVILCGGQLVNALAGSVSFVLAMTGHHDIVAKTLVYTTLGHVALCMLLVPYWGAEGAAWATASAIGISNIALVLLCRRRLSIDPSVVGIGKTFLDA